MLQGARRAFKDWAASRSASKADHLEGHAPVASPNEHPNGGVSSTLLRRKRTSAGNRRLTLMKHVGSASEAPLAFNKESFERVLMEWELFCEFRHYSLTVDLCMENIQFWESVCELEELLSEHDPTYRNGLDSSTSTWALTRFLNKPQAALYPVYPVPASVATHFLYFHATFLARDAPLEVNVPGKVRFRIQSDIAKRPSSAGKGQAAGDGFLTNIFDQAVDEVIGLLYLNTFKGFVSHRDKNGPVFSHGAPSGKGEHFPWSTRSKSPNTSAFVTTSPSEGMRFSSLRRRMSFQDIVTPPTIHSADAEAQAAYMQMMRDANFRQVTSPTSPGHSYRDAPSDAATGNLSRTSSISSSSIRRRASLDVKRLSRLPLSEPAPPMPIPKPSVVASASMPNVHLPSPSPSPTAAGALASKIDITPRPPPRKVMVSSKSPSPSPSPVPQPGLQYPATGPGRTPSPAPPGPVYGSLDVYTTPASPVVQPQLPITLQISSRAFASSPALSKTGSAGGASGPSTANATQVPPSQEYSLPTSAVSSPTTSSSQGTLPVNVQTIKQLATLPLSGERQSSLASSRSIPAPTPKPIKISHGRSSSLHNPVRVAATVNAATAQASPKQPPAPQTQSPTSSVPTLTISAAAPPAPFLSLPDSPSFAASLSPFAQSLGALDFDLSFNLPGQAPARGDISRKASANSIRSTASAGSVVTAKTSFSTMGRMGEGEVGPTPPPRVSSSSQNLKAAAAAAGEGEVRGAGDVRRRALNASP
ncbi:hypothetical protein HDU96_000047 [Phlyctochytrium bullatum]|nr:hypothetical protein HDU96_000047 [Phlyctochytrium bullatum]